MATNYDLLSSCASSESSAEDDASSPDNTLDLTYRSMDSSALETELEHLRPAAERMLLYNNRIERLPPAIARFKSLRVLDLSNNMIRTLPDELSSMTTLVQLFLRNNLIGDHDFPKSLASLASLRDLNLSGNRLTTIPAQIFELSSLRNLFLGGNRLSDVPSGIRSLRKLRVFYLGGNQIQSLPSEISQLANLHALILADNLLESLPPSICSLSRLQCLQLHKNRLTTLPSGLVHLRSLSELSLRENPLVVRFVREMTYQPSSLLELAARVITINRLPVTEGELPSTLAHFLCSSNRCLNPKCKGVYFNSKVEHVKFVDFCGKFKVPLMQYLCSSGCTADRPAVSEISQEEESSKMKRVLLG